VRIAGYFGYAECADAVFACSGEADEAVRRAALEQIPFLGEARALRVLVQAIEQDTDRARASAATALGRIEGPVSRASLERGLGDRDAWVRYFAARALGQHAHAGSLDRLAALAKEDAAPHVRIAALESIGAIDGPRAAGILAPFAEDPDPAIGVPAIVALGGVPDAAALPPVQHALRSGDPARRLAAVRALAARAAEESLDLLRWTAVGDDDGDVARAALEGLARLAAMPDGKWAEAVDALVDLTAEPKCREDAVHAIARLPSRTAGRVARGLRHTALEVRRATIDALTRMKHPDASAHVRAALGDEDATVRETAVRALDRIGARGLSSRLSLMAAGDPDPAVRRAASSALSRQPGPEGEGGASG
jgi:HEAT repeat protein